MRITKQMNIRNRPYYFHNNLINIKDFDPKLLKLDKKKSMDIDIYYIEYITKKDEYKINSANLLFLLVHSIDDFIEGEKGNEYLNIASTDKNSEALKNYSEVWNRIKDCIEKINDSKSGEYDKDYMKIKFN